jgi:signal transduction histidine kinase
MLDRERDELHVVAGYHVPRAALPVLAASAVTPQPFWPEVMRAGDVVGSDDIANDPRFAFPLFRDVRHQSGVVVPLVVDGQVAGTFYLVWWSERRRLEVEFRMKTPAGDWRWLTIRGRPRQLDDGSTMWDVIGLDITERKAADDRLRAAEREVATLHAVASLANATAHEISNPLMVIVGNLSLLFRGRDDEPRVRATLTAVKRIEDIVRLMQRVTRLEVADRSSQAVPPMLDIRASTDGS